MLYIKKYHKSFALLFFALIAILYFGWGLINHLNSAYSGDGNDKYIYIWSMAWWPHALLHHLNPFIAKVVWVPEGINLAKVTAFPGLALLAMPITLIFGPVAAYNLVTIFSPALAAWTAYLLGYYVLRSSLLALLIGYLFGYSAYIIAQMLGHLVLVAPAFLIPLFPLLLLYRLDGKISVQKCTLLFALCLVILFSISSEIFITFTFWGGISYLLAIFCFSNLREQLINFIKIIVIAYLLAAVVLSPYIYFFFSDKLMDVIGNDPIGFSNDLLGFFLPHSIFLVSTSGARALAMRFSGNWSEWNSYLGGAVLLIYILFVAQFWKTSYGRYLSIITGILAIASLGPVLHIAGVEVLSFPWKNLFLKVPVLNLALPARLGLFTSLSMAFCVALWLKNSNHRPAIKAILLAIGILCLLPSFNPAFRPTIARYEKPDFISSGMYKKYLSATDNVLTLPYFNNSPSLLWQVETDFSFNFAGGYLGPTPPALYHQDSSFPYFLDSLPKESFNLAMLNDFITKHKVTAIVVTPDYYQWKPLLEQIDKQPKVVGGVTIYRPHKLS